jgi:transposase
MIPYVLATLFLKEGEVLDDIDISGRAAIMGRVPLTQAMNAYFFLARSASTWLKRINRYLEAKVMPKPAKPELVH